MQNLVPFRSRDREGWSVRFRQHGKQRRKTFRRRQDALRFAKEKERELETGLVPEVSLEELAARYVATYQGAESSRTKLRILLSKATSTFSEIPVSSLTTEEVERFALTLPIGHRHETIASLKSLLRWGGRAGLCAKGHPAIDARNPKPKRAEVSPLSWTEILAISEAIDPRYAALIVFVGSTGLRPGEWCVLRWSDIAFGQIPTVTVQRRLTLDGIVVAETKSGVRRQVPLTPSAVRALKNAPHRIHSKLIFPAPGGGIINLRNFRRRTWDPAVRRLGYCDDNGRATIKPNLLRHSFCTRALAAGVSIHAIARMMGNSLEVISKTYAHLEKNALTYDLALLTAADPAVFPQVEESREK